LQTFPNMSIGLLDAPAVMGESVRISPNLLPEKNTLERWLLDDCFKTVWACDGQADGRTPSWGKIPRYAYASRGKNERYRDSEYNATKWTKTSLDDAQNVVHSKESSYESLQIARS